MASKKTAKRSDPDLWEQIKAEVLAGDKGGLPGQWSARKAQLAVQRYVQAGGGYLGPKDPENSLAKWTRQQWRTKSGYPSLETGERYLPSAALSALSDAEYEETTRLKRRGLSRGEQHTPQPRKISEKTAPYRKDHAMKKSPKKSTRRNPVKTAPQPGLFGGEDFGKEIRWSEATPAELIASADHLDGEEVDDILSELKDAVDLVREAGDVNVLLDLGFNPRLADALLSDETLPGKIEEAFNDSVKRRSLNRTSSLIKEFVETLKRHAEWEKDYRLDGDGSEVYFDEFQRELEDDDFRSDAANEILDLIAQDKGWRSLQWILKPQYKDQILAGIVTQALSDTGIYTAGSSEYVERTKDKKALPYYRMWTYDVSGEEWTFTVQLDEEDSVQRKMADRVAKNPELNREIERLLWWENLYPERGWWDNQYDFEVITSGQGSFHAVVFVDDLNAELKRLVEEGFEPLERDEGEVVYRYAGTHDSIAGVSARGMYVVELAPGQLRHESRELGHCVGRSDMPYTEWVKQGKNRIFSIRTETGRSKFTIQFDVPTDRVLQVKGKANRLPEGEDELRLVVEFLTHALQLTPEEVLQTPDIGYALKRTPGHMAFFEPKPLSGRAAARLVTSKSMEQKARENRFTPRRTRRRVRTPGFSRR